ncbi:hypothetical protein HMPREF9278_1269 [Mobiluncus mulieris FB024-16]|nr:hypothetical protein HMPREF9278_1269 [Mobiluncus mulieris FB024-16]
MAPHEAGGTKASGAKSFVKWGAEEVPGGDRPVQGIPPGS